MISAYNSALSALQTFGTRLQSNSNNVANANTNEFKRTRLINRATEPTGVKAEVQKVETPGTKVFEETPDGYEQVELSNVDLGAELTDMNLNTNLYKANLKTIETVDEMTGELLNLRHDKDFYTTWFFSPLRSSSRTYRDIAIFPHVLENFGLVTLLFDSFNNREAAH